MTAYTSLILDTNNQRPEELEGYQEEGVLQCTSPAPKLRTIVGHHTPLNQQAAERATQRAPRDISDGVRAWMDTTSAAFPAGQAGGAAADVPHTAKRDDEVDGGGCIGYTYGSAACGGADAHTADVGGVCVDERAGVSKEQDYPMRWAWTFAARQTRRRGGRRLKERRMNDADSDHVLERRSTYGFGRSLVCRDSIRSLEQSTEPSCHRRELVPLPAARTAFDRPLWARREQALLRGVAAVSSRLTYRGHGLHDDTVIRVSECPAWIVASPAAVSRVYGASSGVCRRDSTMGADSARGVEGVAAVRVSSVWRCGGADWGSERRCCLNHGVLDHGRGRKGRGCAATCFARHGTRQSRRRLKSRRHELRDAMMLYAGTGGEEASLQGVGSRPQLSLTSATSLPKPWRVIERARRPRCSVDVVVVDGGGRSIRWWLTAGSQNCADAVWFMEVGLGTLEVLFDQGAVAHGVEAEVATLANVLRCECY
ncbi:hypothetical protein BJ912DRAFT_926779 [Pholiota molesta]|nr:hypothetical protein BJ912DRAFT_926779 [Pholiota molesta]